MRVVFRTAAYTTSLVALAVTYSKGKHRRRPVTVLAISLLLILLAEAFHPDTAGLLGAIATIAIYLAILAPIFWVPRLELSILWFRRIVTFIWAFQTLSAIVGVLQVYYPGVFQPAIAAVLSDQYIDTLQITLSSGERILRPTGLGDAPGSAAIAGTYSILLAIGLLTDRPPFWARVAFVISIGVGCFVLYICQVRSLVVMVVIAITCMTLVYGAQGRFRRLMGTGSVVAGIATLAFIAAVSVGGDDVSHRLSTLIENNPTDVYYNNRGYFLEHTLTELLPQYPLGAGLGRWGTLAGYFSGPRPDAKTIYVEIQWTGWLLDGGVPLIALYSSMLLVTVVGVWSLARQPLAKTIENESLVSWAAMLVGYDLGTIALTFNFPVFVSSFGTDFWVLNTAILAIAAQKVSRPAKMYERTSITIESGV